jgi:precorrin-6Y C5,15-methyltransferase (decarboxylating)
MTKWLTIIGIGEDGYDGLSSSAKQAIGRAEIIVGSQRTLAFMPDGSAKQVEWPQPFSAVVDALRAMRGKTTVVLATGDPMNFGAARKILEFIPINEISIHPHLSAFTLAASKLGWSLPDCDCFTIHGRPAANLETFIQPDAKLLVLTQDAGSIAECATRLSERGFGDSHMTVLENLGGASERVTSFTAATLPTVAWSNLNTLAVHCIAGEKARLWSRVGGLPDDAFIHDGNITKREVRAATLAALAPAPGQVLWDIGAGSGSVAIEWMRSTRGCEAIAIEEKPERCVAIASNADALGAARLKVVQNKAPDGLLGLAQPHAIFIGGGIDDKDVFETAWGALRVGGNLVANCVTLEGDSRLIGLQKIHGGDLVRMDVSHLTHVGPMRAMRPRMSVLQWRVRKP